MVVMVSVLFLNLRVLFNSTIYFDLIDKNILWIKYMSDKIKIECIILYIQNIHYGYELKKDKYSHPKAIDLILF